MSSKKNKNNKTKQNNNNNNKNKKQKNNIKINSALWKNVWYHRKWNVLDPSLKNFLYFRRNFQSMKFKNFTIFGCWERTFQTQVQKKKVSYNFPYEETKFSNLEYFLMIIIKWFSSFYNIFLTLNKLLLFIFEQISVMLTTILLLFSFFLFRKILIFFTTFFCNLFLFSS